MTVTSEWIAERAGDAQWVEERRKRLADLGWFMKSLKEPVARKSNHDDGCTGASWEGRFRSVAILDIVRLLATCAYIDLNPVAAGIAATPEKSPYTSIKSRTEHYAAQDKLDVLRDDSRVKSKANLGRGDWLFPIEDRRDPNGKGQAGMLHGISSKEYLHLVD